MKNSSSNKKGKSLNKKNSKKSVSSPKELPAKHVGSPKESTPKLADSLKSATQSVVPMTSNQQEKINTSVKQASAVEIEKPSAPKNTATSLDKNNSEIEAENYMQVCKLDPYLKPYNDYFVNRHSKFENWVQKINNEGGIEKFSRGYEQFGFQVTDSEITYREWAPGAVQASLVGDFNNWDFEKTKLAKDKYGVFSATLKHLNVGGKKVPAIAHGSKIKITMITESGERIFRIPAWSRYVVQDLNTSPIYEAVFYNPSPEMLYKPVNKRPVPQKDLRIYEAHVGISTTEMRVGTYNEFTRDVLPRIRDLGYNTIQLMAVMEHAYYASFGYQVTSFFAPSSRCGTPEDLKKLIDTAHGMGISVFLDVVHSHASPNIEDGINFFDGTDNCYFHSGSKGNHELWNSRLFNYDNYEVIRYLLSNLRYWIEVYGFDGFRFDGVTSMIYTHHGIGTGFSGHYDEYFRDSTDESALVYLMLANYMTHSLYPGFVTIAEDVSGMPALCRPVEEGGAGFDYRLTMSVPDMWIKYLKELQDEEWNMGHIEFQLTNRRHTEKSITYCESHDQALVGDKTIAFWLMDKEMYTNMSDLTELTPIIDRGMSLHKMIRLITFGLGGEGYLTFEGNEFGHPEWLDFPRDGNNSSFQYARRQFNLIDDQLLRYKYLNNFEKAISKLEEQFKWLTSNDQYTSLKHEGDKVIVFERGNLVWAFNFHPTNSYTDYRIGVPKAGTYKQALNSDDKQFLGHNRVDPNTEYFTVNEPWNNRPNYMQIYLPSRTAIVFALN
ncbi:1,4-alpha-glucan-branching enzyme [Smittium culicis]|uniref:1,4-alpha-glucan-branching enzyme n=1 Tax=Smittium culicis TaxID=133412 RepID=A0A1R1YRP4_9FUNG|nr:1,4-alpha-glucan-branching enzyme [Smittium culicis]